MTKAITTETEINHGKEPADLPDLKLLWYENGASTITAACTGPDEGLTGVKRSRLHLSAGIGDDIDFIDTIDATPPPPAPTSTEKSKQFRFRSSDQNANNKPTARPPPATHRKMSTPDIGKSTTEITSAKMVETATINVVVSLITTTTTNGDDDDNARLKPTTKMTIGGLHRQQQQQITDTLNKNTTEGVHPPQPDVVLASTTATAAMAMELPDVIAGVSNWKLENDHAYGLSVSLYEKNFITNEQAGNPVADCYGLVVRGNSAAMALADGVNWGKFRFNLLSNNKQ